jgi:hypothetical protein
MIFLKNSQQLQSSYLPIHDADVVDLIDNYDEVCHTNTFEVIFVKSHKSRLQG